jgi:signal peptidase I
VKIIKRHAAAFLDLAQDLLARGNAVRFSAEGASMFPTICDGDPIVVEPVDPETIVVGDIVLYRQRGRAIVHRVAEIRTTPTAGVILVMRGDGKAESDAAVGAHQVLGKVMCIGALQDRLAAVPAWRRARAAFRHTRRRIVTYLSY